MAIVVGGSAPRPAGAPRDILSQKSRGFAGLASIGFVALGAIGFAGAASALTMCSFTTECFEEEACAASDFAMSLSGDVSTMSTEFGDFDVVAELGDGMSSFAAQGDGAVYLLSISEAGAARLSVHMDGPINVTYVGSCTGAE